MKKVLILTISIMIILAFITGCGGSNASNDTTKSTGAVQANANQNTINVKISDYKFDPETININKGDTVIWKNEDPMTHNITSNGFTSPDLNKGDTFSFTFKDAGTFDYICSFHANMKGKVIVK
jgi:plastocyanin